MTCRESAGIAMLCMVLISATMYAQTEQPAQESGTRCTVTTRDGMHLEGTEVGWEADTLILQTDDGVKARIPSSSILAMARGAAPTSQPADESSTEEGGVGIATGIPRSHRGSPNLFMIPTAYSERAGDVRLGLHEVFFPTVAYGLAGYATLQGGTAVFPESEGFFYHTTLKVTPIEAKHGALAAGITLVSLDDRFSTVPFVTGTVNMGGERGYYLTCGAGYQSDEKDYFMTAGLDLPVSDHVRIVTELFLIREQRQISYCTPGVRLQAGSFDIDLGVILPLSKEPFEFLPWIGASVLL